MARQMHLIWFAFPPPFDLKHNIERALVRCVFAFSSYCHSPLDRIRKEEEAKCHAINSKEEEGGSTRRRSLLL